MILSKGNLSSHEEVVIMRIVTEKLSVVLEPNEKLSNKIIIETKQTDTKIIITASKTTKTW
jgi:hypothetical protein